MLPLPGISPLVWGSPACGRSSFLVKTYYCNYCNYYCNNSIFVSSDHKMLSFSSLCFGHSLSSDVDSNGRHFFYQLRSGFFFHTFLQFSDCTRSYFSQSSHLWFVWTAPCSFHFLIMDCTEPTGTLNRIDIFLYPLPASYSFTILLRS